MAAKKKEVVYVPISDNIPNAQQENLSVPDYEDRGIQYKGYAKIAMGAGQFKLKKQETRFYTLPMSVPDDSVTFVRPNAATHIYYCTTMVISWVLFGSVHGDEMQIFDSNTNNPRGLFFLPPNCTGFGAYVQGTSCITVDFSSSPRRFNGDIIANFPSNLVNGEKCVISLFGFDEEI